MQPKTDSLLKLLKGGDRRSIGRANNVVNRVLADPQRFKEVFEGMRDDDPLVRMRAADAVEKITAAHPEYLIPFKKALIRQVAGSTQQEVRWHVAAMFSRLSLTPQERRRVLAILENYLEDKSKIVKTFAMQALADLALQDSRLKPSVIERLKQLMRDGSPAMQSRGRKLLEKLNAGDPE